MMICAIICAIIVLVLFILFGGIAMACNALVFDADRKKIMQEYLEKGVRVCGTVRRQTKTRGTIHQPAVNNAIVSYEAPVDGNHYQMEILLDKKTEKEITETGVVQVLILEDYPASGLPQSYIDPHAPSLSLFRRFLKFGGAALWTAIPALIITNNAPILILMYVLIAVVVTIVIFPTLRSSRRNSLLNFSKKMEGQSMNIEVTEPDDLLNYLWTGLIDLDQKINQVFFSCIKYICRCRSRSSEEAAGRGSDIPLFPIPKRMSQTSTSTIATETLDREEYAFIPVSPSFAPVLPQSSVCTDSGKKDANIPPANNQNKGGGSFFDQIQREVIFDETDTLV